jgi:hypothetical protein
MSSSRNSKPDIIMAIYQNNRSVFRLRDIAMLTGETSFDSINKKLNSLVQKGKLLSPRKGIYVKKNYNKEELACNVFTPVYISLEYVLQKAGVIFQYDTAITSVSYLSRTLFIDDSSYVYRKIKNPILVDTRGIQRLDNHINIATPERAFLDILYLNPTFYFDNLNPLNSDSILSLLQIYNSKELIARVKSTLSYA